VGFQAAERAQRQSAKILLQSPNIVSAQADVVSQISRALEVPQIDVIQVRLKMFLRLKRSEPDRPQALDKGLDLRNKIVVHGRKYSLHGSP
jgi:hypothetical protein